MSSAFRIQRTCPRLAALLLSTSVLASCNGSSPSSQPPEDIRSDTTLASDMPADVELTVDTRTDDVALAERLQTVLDQVIADGLPGAALALRGDRANFSGVSGVAEIDNALPLTTQHRFYLASIGKTYTAVVLVRLAADGLLGLDDPITRWLPPTVTNRIPSSDAITVRMLLANTSGLFDFQNDGNDGEEWEHAFVVDPAREWTNAEVLPFFVDRPLHFEPGADYRYSNSNYVLAVLIAEAAAGIPMPQLVRNLVIEPLELQQTVHGGEAAGLADLAHGYFVYEGKLADVHPFYSHYALGDGGMQASVGDLAAFAHAVLTSDVVLDDAMRLELLAPSGVGSPPSIAGLGIDILADASSGLALYSTGGLDVGARGDVLHMSASGESLTIALCVTASHGDYDAPYERFYEAVLEVLLEAAIMPPLAPTDESAS